MGWLDIVAVIVLVIIGFFVYRSKKNNTLLLLAFFMMSVGWLPSQAASVSLSEARQTAANFLAGHQPAGVRGGIASQLELKLVNTEITGIYTFNVSQDNGFVIVSGDDRLPAVLGYADEGSLPLSDEMPDNLRAWLQGYSDLQAWLDSHPSASSLPATTSLSGEYTAIAPLLTTTWDQHEPYCLRCPQYTFNNPETGEDVKGYSATGCVATAMAQLMYYHRWPAQTTAEISGYTTSSFGLAVNGWPAGTLLEWDKMTPSYGNSSSEASGLAVATLAGCCGASVRMDYGPSSGATDGQAARALKRFFDYDEGIRLMLRSDYSSDEWETTLWNELKNRRPVFYGGQSTGGGHAFVCDGYDGSGYFHVNWGWSGHFNGYFLLSMVNPDKGEAGSGSTVDGYTMRQDMIIGIQPPTGTAAPEEMRLSCTSFVQTGSTETDKNSGVIYFTFGLANFLTDDYGFDIGVGIFDTADKLVEVVWEGTAEQIQVGHFVNYNSGVGGAFIGLDDGVYKMKLLSRQANSSGEWLLCRGADNHYLTAVVTGDKVISGAPAVHLSVTGIAVDGSGKTGDISYIIATVKNESDVAFRDILYMYIDDQLTMTGVSVEAGSTAEIRIPFQPTTAGTKTVTFYADGNKAWIIGETSIGIEQKAVVIYSDAVDLELPFEVEGLRTDASGAYIVGDRLRATVTAVNNTDEAYEGYVILFLYKWEGPNGMATGPGQPVKIAAHSSVSLTFDFNVEYGATYSLVSGWTKHGAAVSYNQEGSVFSFFIVRESTTPDASTAVDTPFALVPDSRAGVYTLDGTKVGVVGQLSQLPKGIYVVGGRKIVR